LIWPPPRCTPCAEHGSVFPLNREQWPIDGSSRHCHAPPREPWLMCIRQRNFWFWKNENGAVPANWRAFDFQCTPTLVGPTCCHPWRSLCTIFATQSLHRRRSPTCLEAPNQSPKKWFCPPQTKKPPLFLTCNRRGFERFQTWSLCTGLNCGRPSRKVQQRQPGFLWNLNPMLVSKRHGATNLPLRTTWTSGLAQRGCATAACRNGWTGPLLRFVVVVVGWWRRRRWRRWWWMRRRSW